MQTLALVVILAFASAAPAAAQVPPDLSGTWELSVTTSSGSDTGTMTLTKDGDKYAATISSAQGQVVPAEVFLKDKIATIRIVVQSQGTTTTIEFSGPVDGDAMGGSGNFGGRGSGTWSAKRMRPPADAAGTWQLEVETAAGSGTPTFTFKQDGSKLTGRYKGQFGEADVTGSVKGNEVEFGNDVTIEGNTVRVTYTGTIDKDAMKGTVKFGELAQGTFKGVRKGP